MYSYNWVVSLCGRKLSTPDLLGIWLLELWLLRYFHLIVMVRLILDWYFSHFQLLCLQFEKSEHPLSLSLWALTQILWCKKKMSCIGFEMLCQGHRVCCWTQEHLDTIVINVSRLSSGLVGWGLWGPVSAVVFQVAASREFALSGWLNWFSWAEIFAVLYFCTSPFRR